MDTASKPLERGSVALIRGTVQINFGEYGAAEIAAGVPHGKYIDASSSDVECAETYWAGEYREEKLANSAQWIQELIRYSHQMKKEAKSRGKRLPAEAPEDWECVGKRRREARRNKVCEELGMGNLSWLTEGMDPIASGL